MSGFAKNVIPVMIFNYNIFLLGIINELTVYNNFNIIFQGSMDIEQVLWQYHGVYNAITIFIYIILMFELIH